MRFTKEKEKPSKQKVLPCLLCLQQLSNILHKQVSKNQTNKHLSFSLLRSSSSSSTSSSSSSLSKEVDVEEVPKKRHGAFVHWVEDWGGDCRWAWKMDRPNHEIEVLKCHQFLNSPLMFVAFVFLHLLAHLQAANARKSHWKRWQQSQSLGPKP